MYVSAKKIAFLGLLLAFTVLLVISGGIIESNTLFLLAAASFGVGIAIRESGLALGFGFYVASVILNFILSPNKLYVITFSAMGLYLVLMEAAWLWLAGLKKIKNRKVLFWFMKYVIFNIIYIPILLFFHGLLYPGTISTGLFAAFFFWGQVGLFIYDLAYNYFQKSIWGKIRGRFHIGE